MSLCLMAVHAHPDDEVFLGGGAMARYASEGVRTVLVTCTDGAVGEISDPALATPENLAEVRAGELDESVRILGIRRLAKLGYLTAEKQPGRTRERTHYRLTDQGREALQTWLAKPAAMPRISLILAATSAGGSPHVR